MAAQKKMTSSSIKKKSSVWVDVEDIHREAHIPGIENGWFTESEEASLWPGQRFSLALEDFSASKSVLFYERSEFQWVLVFRSATYGNVLVLDGVIQMTTRDVFAYTEIMTHIPLCSMELLPSSSGITQPGHVLIIGGGDGRVLRDILNHYDVSIVQSITIVEIDPMVIDVARKYFDADSFYDDERVTVVNADAASFLAERKDDDIQYSAIIGDTSDPVGPAEVLFQEEFYRNLYRALAVGGVACMQAECYWLHLDWIQDRIACCRNIFDSVEYATTSVPSYPCGQIGFLLARKGIGKCSCQIPLRQPDEQKQKLCWYSPELHRASFVLPAFVKERFSFEENSHSVDDDNGKMQLDINQKQSIEERNIAAYKKDECDQVHRCFIGDAIRSTPVWTENWIAKSKSVYEGNRNDIPEDEEDQQHECFLKLPVHCRSM